MLFSLLFLLSLAQEPVRQAAAPPVLPLAAAIQMADVGREAEALAAFQRLAAVNPNDHQARLWIARLHERMGHADRAEAVYRSVLLEDPSSVDAMIGVGTTLLARHSPEEAIDFLERAEALSPQNDDILAALGRAHQEAGHTVRALEYLERAVALSPSEPHVLSLEAARRSYLHRVEARGFGEDFSGSTPGTTGGGVTVNVRLRETWRVFGRGDAQRKFGVSEQRGGGGVEWRWKPLTTLAAHALIGPGNDVMPEGDYLGEIDHTYDRASWTGTLRYLNFNGASVTVLAPAVTWWASDRLSLGLRYALAITSDKGLLTRQAGHSLLARGAYRFRPRLWFTGGYAAGVEDFDTISADQIGDFRANSLSGGARLDLASLTSVVGIYDYQWRTNSVRRGRFTLSLAQRF